MKRDWHGPRCAQCGEPHHEAVAPPPGATAVMRQPAVGDAIHHAILAASPGIATLSPDGQARVFMALGQALGMLAAAVEHHVRDEERGVTGH